MPLVPPVVTLVLFLILYNNLHYGRAIVLFLVALNAGVLLAPNANPHRRSLSSAKAGALCVVTALGVVLALEFAFPRVFPGEYAHIRDLSKGVNKKSQEDLKWFPVVFTNGSNTDWLPAAARPEAERPGPSWNVPGGEFEYYGYEPNEKFRYVNVVRWNAHGYFDSHHDPAKQPGVYRIVFIGDSYVEAAQVPLARSFHKLLEKSLNEGPVAPARPGRKFEVIALGHSGTGHEHHIEILRNEAVAYKPDVVAVTLCGNDFCDDDPQLRRERTVAAGDVTPELRGLAAHGLFAAAFALRRLEELQRNRLKISPELLQWSAEDVPRIESAWKHTLSMVLEEKDFCRDQGIGFALIYLGSDLEVRYALDPSGTVSALNKMHGFGPDHRWDMDKSLRRVTNFCRSNDIHLVSLLNPLTYAQSRTGKLVFGDHYSFFGHEVVAQALKNSLSPLISPPGLAEVAVTRQAAPAK